MAIYQYLVPILFASNRQLALLETAEEGNFPRKIVPDTRVNLGTANYEADTLLIKLLRPLKHYVNIPYCLHLLDALLDGKTSFFQFYDDYSKVF